MKPNWQVHLKPQHLQGVYESVQVSKQSYSVFSDNEIDCNYQRNTENGNMCQNPLKTFFFRLVHVQVIASVLQRVASLV